MADHYFPGLENLKHSLSLTDIDPFIDYTNQLIRNHQQQYQLSVLNSNHIGFPHDNLFPHFPEFPGNSENFPGLSIQGFNNNNLVHQRPVDDVKTISSDQSSLLQKKRKEMESVVPDNSSAYSSPQVSDNGITKKNLCLQSSSGRGKKPKRSDEREDDKTREVVHVRAKRGQATDSHSLAERVRRGKINERLKCLQDIVPGCYKTMGMAVMLDEIINYVQSLQNQVEFLSMKLTAASTYYDFNADIDAIEAMQRSKALEALKMHNVQSQGLPISSHQIAQLNDIFGFLPQLPRNS